jgi:hypothetical protein
MMIFRMPRTFAVAAGAAGLALIAALLLSMAVSPATAHKACGTYKSDSIYPRARVVVIRGVACSRARRVAKHFDHSGSPPGRWQCGYAHGGGRRLFSCGRGGSGSLQDRPHALKAKGIGRPG